MSEIFKIILSFFHNRNEGMMFIHPVTHDAHGLALKKECALAHPRGVFLSYRKEVAYTIKKQGTGIDCLFPYSKLRVRSLGIFLL